MPPKTQSIASLRAKMAQQKPSTNTRELESARRFDEVSRLVNWLRHNWDGETVVLPLPPNFTNHVATQHWSRQAELKAQYKTFIETLHCTKVLAKPPAKPYEPCYIYGKVYLRRRMDTIDNLGALMKWPIDLLRDMGWMVDDNPTKLIWTRPLQQELAGKTPCRIEFTIGDKE